MRLIAIALAAALFPTAFPLVAAQSQDDAGCGCDAPGHPDLPLPIRLAGRYEGNLSLPDDAEDHYRLELRAPWVRLRVEGEDLRVVVRGVALSAPVDVRLEEGWGRVHVEASGPAAGAYVIDVEAPPLPDARVLSVRAFPAGPGPLGVESPAHHRILVEVDNVGAVATDAGATVYVFTARGVETLRLPPRTLAPGESTTFEFSWLAAGHAGRYTAHAVVQSAADADPRNDRGSAEGYVLVPAPYGI